MVGGLYGLTLLSFPSQLLLSFHSLSLFSRSVPVSHDWPCGQNRSVILPFHSLWHG